MRVEWPVIDIEKPPVHGKVVGKYLKMTKNKGYNSWVLVVISLKSPEYMWRNFHFLTPEFTCRILYNIIPREDIK